MDFISAIIICLVIFLMCSLCGYCCRTRKEGAIFSTPVVVTSTTAHTANTGYPVSVEPTASGGFQATPYPTAIPMPMPTTTGAGSQPYPTGPGVMPMPQTTPYPPPGPGFQPTITPYPPAVQDQSQVNPPSYDQVMSSESYGKQAPYNPNYTSASH